MKLIRIEKDDRYFVIYILNLKLSFTNKKSYIKERFCFFEKIKGIFYKNKKYYDVIIPLGRNCEFGINAFKYYGSFDSSIFLWASARNVSEVIEFIKNPDELFSEGCTFTGAGWKCNKLHFAFHSKHKSEYFKIKNSDETDTRKVEEDKKEIESRISYLKRKFKNTIHSTDKKLFVITINIADIPDYKEILYELYSAINENSSNFDFLVIIEQDQYNQDIIDFENKHENIYIRTLKKFAYVDTANKPLDVLGWTKIFNEFKLKNRPSKRRRKKLKYEQ